MSTYLQPEDGLSPDAGPGFGGAAVGSLAGSRRLHRLAAAASPIALAQLGVAGFAAVLYVANLAVSGFANTYYSAAALAASQSWSAWFFGSIDASNFITVDKPPLSTMVMGLSVRLFGLSSWSILLPEALMGVATVVVLMAIVRRTMSGPAAVIAGLVAALTPAAVLIFRYNNPDALLTLLLTAAAYAFVRSLEGGRLRWVTLAAILVGLAFNTKYLQAWLVLPAFAAVWAIAAPGSLGHRLRGLLVAFASVVIASGWWVAVMELLPTTARPFVGGSTNGSALDLVLGYDGLGRIFGGGGPAAAAPGGGGFSGTPGILRLFNDQLGGQVAWFIPLAFLGIAVGLWARGRAPRTDLRRAAFLMWGLWLVIHVAVFSFMSGIIHSYYAVVLAPAIGGLVGGGITELWGMRTRVPWSVAPGFVLAAGLIATAAVAWLVLDRTPAFAPGLGVAILAIATAAALVIALPAVLVDRRLQIAAIGLAIAALLAGPAAYVMDTVQTGIAGGDPAAGPQVADQRRFGGPPGAFGGGGVAGAPGGLSAPRAFAGAGGFARPGGVDVVSSTLTDYLVANRRTARWIVAVTSANQAAAIELATGQPVMAMGGFSGSDPTPTSAELQSDVASGQLRFVVVGGSGGGPGGGGPGGGATDATSWVTTTCSQVSSVSASLYDCSAASTAG